MNLAARSVTFGRTPLADLRRSHVEAWVKSMVTAGLAPGTIRTRTNNVGAVLRAAVRDRVIPADPSAGIALPRTRRSEASMVLPTPEQVAAVLEHSEPWFRPLVALCALAGLRLGEAAAVQVGDVDYLRRLLRVTRQLHRAPGGVVDIRAPKYDSERTVYLADELLALLSQHVETLPDRAPTAWMFEPTPGAPPHQNTVGYQWRAACRRAGLEGFTLHDLRHFYASGLIAVGCDVVTVQRALGHAKATTTLNTYAHLWPTAEDRTRKAAGSLMAVLHTPADFPRTAEG